MAAVLPLSLLMSPAAAHAFEWNSLWLNDDQRAAQRMQREEYAAAARDFDDQSWRAAAWYRAGEHGKAAEAWSKLDDVESHYNRGNALARAGRLHEAAAAYETVLERDPAHGDARHNLEVIKQHMQDSQDSSDRQQEQQDGENRDAGQRESRQGGQQGEQQQQEQQQQSRPGREPENPDQRSRPGQDSSSDGQSPQQRQAERGQAPQDPSRQSEQQRGEQTPPRQAGEREADSPPPEQRAATEQWLRRIPDDPGGLLRRKFRYQYGQRVRGDGPVEQPW